MMVWWLLYYRMKGFQVYANMALEFPHTRLTEMSDFMGIKTPRNVLGLDE